MSGDSDDAIVERAEAVQSEADFSNVLQLLLRDFRAHPDEWENNDLESFLEAMGRFVNDMDGYYSRIKREVNSNRPDWRVFADILLASRVYE